MNPIKRKRELYCITCDQTKPMTPSEAVNHLQKVHSVDTTLPYTRSATAFMDGKGFYHNEYEWLFGKVRLKEVETGPKGGGRRG